jgi:hypothetical protein
MADPKGTKAVPDGMKVSAENVTEVAMEDLSEKDREEIEGELQRELEEVMVERRKKKLACFQKTRSGIVKNGDTTKASTPVNSPFTLEVLVQMIDVLVNSKYGADLEGITRTLMNNLHSSVESLRVECKQDSENALARQARATVQQVLGESRGKREVKMPGVGTPTLNVSLSIGYGSSCTTTIGMGNQGRVANPNLQQPFYQANTYGSGVQTLPDGVFYGQYVPGDE